MRKLLHTACMHAAGFVTRRLAFHCHGWQVPQRVRSIRTDRVRRPQDPLPVQPRSERVIFKACRGRARVSNILELADGELQGACAARLKVPEGAPRRRLSDATLGSIAAPRSSPSACSQKTSRAPAWHQGGPGGSSVQGGFIEMGASCVYHGP